MSTPNEGINGTLGNGLLAHWSFDNRSFLDSSGNGNTLIPSLDSYFISVPDKDLIANSAIQAKTTNHLYNDTLFTEVSDNYSVSVWFKASATETEPRGVMSVGQLFAHTFIISVDTSLRMRFLANGTWSSYYSVNAGWNHVIIGNGYMALNGNRTTTTKYISVTEPTRLYLFRYNSAHLINIPIDETRIYNRNLTSDECAELFEMGVNYTGDTNPPTFNTINSTTTNKINLRVNCNEDATLWYKLYNRGATAPTSEQLKSTHDGEVDLLENITKDTYIYLWKGDTNYDLYVVAEDMNGNLQTTPTKLQFTSPRFLTTYPPRANRRYDIKLNEFFTNVGTQLGLTLTLPAFNDNNWDVTILTALSTIESNLKTQLDKPKRDDKNYDVKLNRCLSKIINVINGEE